MIEVIKKHHAHPETEKKIFMLLYRLFTGYDYPDCTTTPKTKKKIPNQENIKGDDILPAPKNLYEE